MPIVYLKGDATAPQGKGPKIIAHIANDQGGWGAGFVLAISKRWAYPEQMYRQWYRQRDPINNPEPIVMTSGRFQLGETQLVMVASGLAVANMVSQAGMRTSSKGPPIRYDSLQVCLEKVRDYADSFKASVHMPRIGTGLAQGDWRVIEPIIQKALSDIDTYVYDFSG